MNVLGWAEDLPPKRVRDHDLVGNFHRVHEISSSLASQPPGIESTDTRRSIRRRKSRGDWQAVPRKQSVAKADFKLRGPEQCERSRKAPAFAPARTTRSRDIADLAGQQPQSPAMECFPERKRISPLPYQLISMMLLRLRQSAARWQAPRTWRSHEKQHRSRRAHCSAPANRAPSARASSARARRDVHHCHLRARQSAHKDKQQASRPSPPPTTAIRSAGPGAPSHTALSAVSILAASTARRGAHHRVRQTRALGQREQSLVRMQAKHNAIASSGRARSRHARHRIAVFDGKRKRAPICGDRMRWCSLPGTRPE